MLFLYAFNSIIIPNATEKLFYTKLPDKKLLSEKSQRAIAVAKEHYRLKESQGE